MRKILKLSTGVFSIILVVVLFLGIFFAQQLPNDFFITDNDAVEINSSINKFITVSKNEDSSIQTNRSNSIGDYDVDMKLLGVIPLKTARVKTQDRQYVSPCGTPFGIKIYTHGVIIVGMMDVDSISGSINPAKSAGLQIGDCIMQIGETTVLTTEDVAKAFENCDGNPVSVIVQRAGDKIEVSLTPILSSSQKIYKAGLWVRDSSAGIGTLTFYHPTAGVYGGLGHAVCDVDTGEILPLLSGGIVEATITSCNPSKNGTPGELCGYFHNENPLGEVQVNGETGVYGIAEKPLSDNSPLPVALKQEIEEGKAQIICTIDEGPPKHYDIEIVKICYNSDSKQKNMVIKVTDEALLKKTGGIVQGMSGSPIIQNDMLVGAVTHVFVNNAKQGYAIFAENMMDTVERAFQLEKKAS